MRALGSYIPKRIVTNEELEPLVGSDSTWIRDVSGIEERRFAADDETVVDLACAAAEDCLSRADLGRSEIGMVVVSSGTTERRFPGPAVSVGRRLGLDGVPCIDLPLASAGTLFGLSVATELARAYRNVLVIGAEKMSCIATTPPVERGVAILFGDGAGACIVSSERGFARVQDSALFSDGSFEEDLQLGFGGPLRMNGRSVIMQATRKLPRAIADLLARNSLSAGDVETFVLHQANQNLIDRVAQALEVDSAKFFSNIRLLGNTSSASLLIAAAEWFSKEVLGDGERAVFAAFGAGFHWGAMLLEGCPA